MRLIFLNPQEDPSELGLLPDSTTTPFLANARVVLTILDWGKNVAVMIVDTALYLWPNLFADPHTPPTPLQGNWHKLAAL